MATPPSWARAPSAIGMWLCRRLAGLLRPPPGECAAQQVAKASLGVGGLYRQQPAFAVRIAERELCILHDRLVDIGNGALDRRNNVDCATVAMDSAHLLSLANPLAALRQRNTLQLAGQFGGEVVHATRTRLGLSLNAQV